MKHVDSGRAAAIEARLQGLPLTAGERAEAAKQVQAGSDLADFILMGTSSVAARRVVLGCLIAITVLAAGIARFDWGRDAAGESGVVELASAEHESSHPD